MNNTERTKDEWFGVADTATDTDWLEMEPRYKGITEFIKKCQTPITIAIQGDWGVGKTSAMKNIEFAIKGEAKNPCIWFKTWQFSAIKDSSNIIPEFMLTLLDKLGEIALGIKVMHTLQVLLEEDENNFPSSEMQKKLEDYIKAFERDMVDLDELDSILQDVREAKKKSSNTSTGDLKKWEENLNKLQEKIKKEYGIPIKKGKESEAWADDEIGAGETAFEFIKNTMDMVKNSKKKIFCYAGIMAVGAAGIGLEATLPGLFGKLGGDAVSKIGEKAIDFLGNGRKDGNTAKGEGENSEAENYQSSTLFLVKICNEINRVIRNILKYYGQKDSRVCIFVDDLDRLKPEVALELLEGVKNFAEYENTVFILAIDKAVIDQGLRSKYDEKFLFGESDDRSGRNRADKFFDKIIQVPFTLPAKSYNLSEYMKNLLKMDDEQIKQYKIEKKPTSEDYALLLQELDVYNPRSIKRCFNLQVLYDCMTKALPDSESGSLIKEWYRFCYFAITILQIENVESYQKLYSLSLMNSENGVANLEEIKENLREEEEENIGIVLNCFEKAQVGIGGEDAKQRIGEWLNSMLISSNYGHSFNEKQIYIQRLKWFVEEIKKDNAKELDLSELEVHLNKDEKELSENFGRVVKATKGDNYIKIGWGKNRPRPYIILGVGEKSSKEALKESTPFFEEYHKGETTTMKNDVNYYIADHEFSIYISPNETKAKECLKVLKNLGYVSGK